MTKRRLESEAFVEGFMLAWRSIDLVKPLNRDTIAANGKAIRENEQQVFADVQELADELYPPFDAFPAPAKAFTKMDGV
jgi:hypothetical protein